MPIILLLLLRDFDKTLSSLGLGFPIKKTALYFSRWAAIDLQGRQFSLVCIPRPRPLNAHSSPHYRGNQRTPHTFPTTPGLQTAICL